eukprot:scaffold97841_cov63-Phaeocystis_antarctica.AAC.3
MGTKPIRAQTAPEPWYNLLTCLLPTYLPRGRTRWPSGAACSAGSAAAPGGWKAAESRHGARCTVLHVQCMHGGPGGRSRFWRSFCGEGVGAEEG